jgi:MoaA/NifB/PqqE/SkfB family radical SAM enzyme
MASALRYMRLALGPKHGATPVYLIHHITDRCNAKCRHCFIIHDGSYAVPDGVSGGDVLTLDEIERLTRTLGPNLYTVQLTGGEPFLRADLLGIVRNYYRNSCVRYVQICTNGRFTDRIVPLAEAVVSEDPTRLFGFSISVDDIGERHDENRGVKGLFDSVVETVREIQQLQRVFPRLQLSVNVTVSKYNEDRLLDIYEYLTGDLRVGNIVTTLIRGNPSDRGACGVDISKYERFVEHCADGWWRGKHQGFKGFLEARLVNAQNVVTHRNNVRLVREPTGPGNVCYAGDLSCVIYADGAVGFCEEVPFGIGNLRDWDLDFTRMWRSEVAERVRARRDATPCRCTHECFAIPNVLFNPRKWPEIAAVAAGGGVNGGSR